MAIRPGAASWTPVTREGASSGCPSGTGAARTGAAAPGSSGACAFGRADGCTAGIGGGGTGSGGAGGGGAGLGGGALAGGAPHVGAGSWGVTPAVSSRRAPPVQDGDGSSAAVRAAGTARVAARSTALATRATIKGPPRSYDMVASPSSSELLGRMEPRAYQAALDLDLDRNTAEQRSRPGRRRRRIAEALDSPRLYARGSQRRVAPRGLFDARAGALHSARAGSAAAPWLLSSRATIAALAPERLRRRGVPRRRQRLVRAKRRGVAGRRERLSPAPLSPAPRDSSHLDEVGRRY